MPDTIDIFVSYAHADDDVPRGSRSGWVTTLVDELKKILRRKLGGSGAEIWMDHQLAAHKSVSAELLSRLRSCRTLVLVMSPGYQKSHWCQRELANFLLASEAKQIRNNVFIVEIEPIERTSWSRDLQDLELTPVRFWQREFDDAAPLLLGYPVPPADGSSPYWKNLNELAHWLAQRLSEQAISHDKKRMVLVAETTDDLDEQRESVTGLLRQNGFTAVPFRAYPRDTEASYLRALRSDLGEAALFVQLLGPYEGKRLPDGTLPVVALQSAEAFAAHRQRALKVLQWRESGLDLGHVRSDAHRALLSGRFVRACGFEEFRQEILKAGHAQAGADQAGLPISAPERSAKEFSIFVDADQIDHELAMAVCDSLRVYDVVPVASEANSSPFARGIEQQRETIRRCNGVLFIYGRATLSWLSAEFGYAAQARGLRKDDVWGGVLDGPPAGESKVPFRNKNLMNLDCRDGFDPARLGWFVDSLRRRPGDVRV